MSSRASTTVRGALWHSCRERRSDALTAERSMLTAVGFWLLAFGFWLLAFGFWLLAFGSKLDSENWVAFHWDLYSLNELIHRRAQYARRFLFKPIVHQSILIARLSPTSHSPKRVLIIIQRKASTHIESMATRPKTFYTRKICNHLIIRIKQLLFVQLLNEG